jgi:aspartate/methionine/tyrosine aminotransferase
MKHEPSKRTEVHNLIRRMLENELKIPANPHKPLVNLGLGILLMFKFLGEPTKANGYDLPPVINEALIEQVKKETCNGYTMSSGTLEARKAIVEK